MHVVRSRGMPVWILVRQHPRASLKERGERLLELSSDRAGSASGSGALVLGHGQMQQHRRYT